MDAISARKLIIAIDGPAGAGKSTIASRLARKLGYTNLESGAMYRALALKAIEWDVSFDDEKPLRKLAEQVRIGLEPTIGGNRVMLDGKDVSTRIRDRDVTEAASRVSVHPAVREWMVARQQDMGKDGGVVMEGRDIGTRVFPDADLKIFLDADPVVREQRRMAQQKIQGEVAASVAAELRERDRRDRTRAASPLVAAGDAVIINSTSLSEDEVLARAEQLLSRVARSRLPFWRSPATPLRILGEFKGSQAREVNCATLEELEKRRAESRAARGAAPAAAAEAARTDDPGPEAKLDAEREAEA